MKKNKLKLLLAALNKIEIKRFDQFLRQPNSNKNAAVIRLVEFLKKELKKQEALPDEELRQMAAQKIFPKEVNGVQKIGRLLSVGTALLIDFLKQEELQRRPDVGEELLRLFYREKQLDSFFISSLKQSQKGLNNSPYTDFQYHFAQMKVQHELYYNANTDHYSAKDILADLLDLHMNLDLAYILSKFHYAVEVEVIRQYRGLDAKVPFLEETLKMAEATKSHPLVSIYLKLLNLLNTADRQEFDSLRQEMFAGFALVSENIRLQLFGFLVNVSGLVIERSLWPEVLFDLYEEGLEQGVLLENGVLEVVHFNNIVSVGSSLRKFDRVRHIIKQYFKLLILKEGMENQVKHYYEALVLFGEGKFDKALQQVNYLGFSDVSYGIRSHILSIMCYYETKNSTSFKPLDDRCNAFKQYLHRKYKDGFISAFVRAENLNFIKIVVKLPIASKKRLALVSTADLKSKLKEMDRVVQSAWLLAKIDQIERL